MKKRQSPATKKSAANRADGLAELVQTWKAMTVKSEAERTASETFYHEHIFPIVLDEFVARHARPDRHYDLLIAPVGTSSEPIIMAIRTLNPTMTLLLHTQESLPLIDTIVAIAGLRATQYQRAQIAARDAIDIYREVRNALSRLAPGAKVAVDVTGGKKSMVAGAALAGAVMDADLFYVDSEHYLIAQRRPEPGSEFYIQLTNPYEVFGDLEEERAREHFNQEDYAGARQILEHLYVKVPDPRRYHILGLLASAYEAWDAFDLVNARDRLVELCDSIFRYCPDCHGLPLVEHQTLFDQQRQLLDLLIDTLLCPVEEIEGKLLGDIERTAALIFTLMANADRRVRQNRFDMASLLCYRVLEMLSQRRLAQYGISTGDPDYKKLPLPPSDLLDRFNRLRRSAGLRGDDYRWLPNELSLFNGFLILAALDDDLVADLKLKVLNERVRSRNFSMFAHGFRFITAKQYESFANLVAPLLAAFCAIEHIDQQRMEHLCAFVRLDHQPPAQETANGQ